MRLLTTKRFEKDLKRGRKRGKNLAAAFEAGADECKAVAIRFIQAVLKGERGEMMSNEGGSALLN